MKCKQSPIKYRKTLTSNKFTCGTVSRYKCIYKNVYLYLWTTLLLTACYLLLTLVHNTTTESSTTGQQRSLHDEFSNCCCMELRSNLNIGYFAQLWNEMPHFTILLFCIVPANSSSSITTSKSSTLQTTSNTTIARYTLYLQALIFNHLNLILISVIHVINKKIFSTFRGGVVWSNFK